MVTQHGIGSFVSEALPEEPVSALTLLMWKRSDLVNVLELRVSLETESAGLGGHVAICVNWVKYAGGGECEFAACAAEGRTPSRLTPPPICHRRGNTEPHFFDLSVTGTTVNLRARNSPPTGQGREERLPERASTVSTR